MCLGVPARLVETYERNDLPMGKADFGGVRREVCLSYTPEASVDDFVLVHVGFALSVIDEEEARQTLATIAEIEESTAMLSEDGDGDRPAGENAPPDPPATQ